MHRYATAENLLVEYGGLKRENDTEFSTDDKVLEVNIRPGTTEVIQIPANEVSKSCTIFRYLSENKICFKLNSITVCVTETYILLDLTVLIRIVFMLPESAQVGVTVTWDVTVVGYEVGYKEEFVPDDDCSYIVLIQEKKMLESIRNSFHIREPGKLVITIVNGAYTKKKAFYRYKSCPSVPMYMLIKSYKPSLTL